MNASVLAFLGGLLLVGHCYDWKLSTATPVAIAHGIPRAPQPAPAEASVAGPRSTWLRLASSEAAAKAAIRTCEVESVSLPEYVTATGSLLYDRTRVAQLAPRAAGVVFDVLVKAGDPVQAGDALALVESAEVGKAKTEFLQALVSCELKEKLAAGSRQVESVLPARRLLELESNLREARVHLLTARQGLLNLGLTPDLQAYRGLSDEQLFDELRTLGLPARLKSRLDAVPSAANLIAMRAPFGARVISAELVKGEAVHPGKPEITLVDTTVMWVVLEVASEDSGRLRCGQELSFRPDGMADVEVKSTIAWISTEADAKTRRVQVRAEVPNGDGQLRANSFGTGKIKVRPEASGLAVAAEALHWDLEQKAHLVFVCRDEQTFEACPVRVGVRQGSRTEISPLEPGSLRPGERVAAEGSYVLKSELLRQRLTGAR
jgi:cobalt-zinc-cadmium efflux system membrane fusion protein